MTMTIRSLFLSTGLCAFAMNAIGILLAAVTGQALVPVVTMAGSIALFAYVHVTISTMRTEQRIYDQAGLPWPQVTPLTEAEADALVRFAEGRLRPWPWVVVALEWLMDKQLIILRHGVWGIEDYNLPRVLERGGSLSTEQAVAGFLALRKHCLTQMRMSPDQLTDKHPSRDIPTGHEMARLHAAIGLPDARIRSEDLCSLLVVAMQDLVGWAVLIDREGDQVRQIIAIHRDPSVRPFGWCAG